MSFLAFLLLAVVMARPIRTFENHLKDAKSPHVQSLKVSIHLVISLQHKKTQEGSIPPADYG